MKRNDLLTLFMPALNGGGAERVMLGLAKEFLKRGYSVDLVTCKKRAALREFLPSGVNYIVLNALVLLSSVALARYLHRSNPQVIMSTLINANVACALAHWLIRSPARLILRLENNVTHLSGDASLPMRLARDISPWLFPRAHRIVAISEGVRVDADKWYARRGGRVVTIYNPIDLEQVDRLAGEAPPHAWLAQSDCPVVLGAGRLVPQKDFGTLIRAFAVLRRQRACKLIILGEGPERQKLEEQIRTLDLADDVALPGFTGNPYSWMKHSAVLAVSSGWEGFCNVVVEALACGCQVVSTDCPSGPREILEDGRYGRLVAIADADAMAAAIESALTAPIDRNLMRARADEFRMANIADQYLSAMHAA